MTYGLDTSVVLRLLTGEPKELALQAIRRVAELLGKGERCFIGDLVVAEAYYALQFHYEMPKSEALAALLRLGGDDDGIRFSGEAGKILPTPNLAQANPGFVDRLIHADYQQAGLIMLTCENAAKKLDSVEVVKPGIR